MSTRTIMSRQSPSKLSLAELLIVLALVGVALAIARVWWDAWEAEEWTFATGWLAAWVVGVVGGRALLGRAVLPASALCALASFGVSLYLRLPWAAMGMVAATAFLLALTTASVPWALVLGSVALQSVHYWPYRYLSLGSLGAAILVTIGIVLMLRFHSPAVTAEVIRQFEDAGSAAPQSRRNARSLECMSPGGRFLALRGKGDIEIYDTVNRSIRALPRTRELDAFRFSHDARFLACWSRKDDMDLESLQLIAVSDGSRVLRIPLKGLPDLLAFNNDGEFWIGDSTGDSRQLQVEVWALDTTPRIVRRWQFEIPETAWVANTTSDGMYGLVSYDEDQTITRWQIWKLVPPASLIMDSNDTPFPWGLRFSSNGEWFASNDAIWNRSLTTQIEIDGNVLGIGNPDNYVAVLRHNFTMGPPFPQTGLSDELMNQLPFWRLLNDRANTVELWLYDPRHSEQVRRSPAIDVDPEFHWRTPLFNTEAAPDCSAVAVQDKTGKIILWRIRR